MLNKKEVKLQDDLGTRMNDYFTVQQADSAPYHLLIIRAFSGGVLVGNMFISREQAIELQSLVTQALNNV